MAEFAIALCGGMLIGLAASLLLLGNGRIAGISGMVAGLLPASWAQAPKAEIGMRASFLLGLLLAGVLALLLDPAQIGQSPRSLAWLAAAGLLTGIGTRLSGGCTSGHGVCGISRWSRRSIVATATFVVTAIATVALMRLVGAPP
jgi:uncharacterized membrane protein YedE/YeeE